MVRLPAGAKSSGVFIAHILGVFRAFCPLSQSFG